MTHTLRLEGRVFDSWLDHSLANPALRQARPRTGLQALVAFANGWSPRILALGLATAAGARLGVGGLSMWDAIIPAIIVLFWPIQEWLIHVLVLHWRPRTVFGVHVDPPTPRSHRRHHQNPTDLAEVFIPLWVYPYAIPLLVGLWTLLPTAVGLTGLTTYFALALNYEFCHYMTHIPWTPNTAHHRRLCREHMRHHFHNEQFWFGVSMIGGDRLLRTRPEPSTVPRSPNCRDLGVATD